MRFGSRKMLFLSNRQSTCLNFVMQRALYIILTLAITLSAATDGYGQAKPKKKKKFEGLYGKSSDFLLQDSFKFITVRNDPEHEPNLSIYLTPAVIEMYGLNVNLGYEASARYSLKKWAFWGLYRGVYAELVNKNTIEQSNSIGGPAQPPVTLMNGEIGGEYLYRTSVENDEELVQIGRYGDYTMRRRVDADYQVKYGIRLGLQYFQTYFTGDQIPISGYYVNDPKKKVYDFGPGQLGTNMQENIVDIGFSKTGIHDLEISNFTLGNRSVSYKTYLYGDLMFAPSIAYTNVLMKSYPDLSREPITDFNVNSSILKSRFGGRVGFLYTNLTKLGIDFGFEVGFRPGPSFITGMYGLGKFGVSLNCKTK